ncbi:MAG: cation diffusion facilitator family transporter [Pseudomonadota bacterium]
MTQNSGDKPPTRRFRYKTPSFDTFQIISLSIGVFWIAPRFYAALNSTSIGLLADAVQHIVEVTFAFVVFLSLRAVNRSNAMLFPHGTGKFEALANGLLGMSLLFSALGILAAGVVRLFQPSAPEEAGLGILLLAIALVINTGLYIASAPLERKGKAVIRTWRQMYVVDIAMKVTTILFVFVAAGGGIWVYLDPIAALLIGAFMLYIAYKALTDSIWELSDRALEEDVQMRIVKGLADNFHTFDDLIDVRTRRVGGKPVIEVVVGFFENRSWPYVLHSCKRLQEEIRGQIGGAEVLVIPSDQSIYVPEPDTPTITVTAS